MVAQAQIALAALAATTAVARGRRRLAAVAIRLVLGEWNSSCLHQSIGAEEKLSPRGHGLLPRRPPLPNQAENLQTILLIGLHLLRIM